MTVNRPSVSGGFGARVDRLVSRGSRPSQRVRRAHLVAGAAFVACLGAASTARAVSSAELYTPSGYGYGRFEARVMFPQGDGVVGSFFLWKSGSEMAGTYWNELDFEKVNANCTLEINSIYGLPSVQHQRVVSNASSPCSAYHTYAYEWTPDYIAWSVDGQEIRRDTGAGATAYSDNALMEGLQIRFNIWPGDSSFGGNFSASILPVEEYVSWVQYATYTPGTGDVACNFTLAWRESFEQGIPSSWSVGNWASPKNLSTHSPSNVTATNGIAVLSLTADTMLGFTGMPPADDGDLPSVQASGADASGPADAAPLACDGGGSPLDGGGASDAGGGSTPDSGGPGNSGNSGGCGCNVGSSRGADGVGAPMAALFAVLGTLHRRRALRRRPRARA